MFATTPTKIDDRLVVITNPNRAACPSTPTFASSDGTSTSKYAFARNMDRPAISSVDSVLPRCVTQKWWSSREPTKASSEMRADEGSIRRREQFTAAEPT